MVLYDIAFIRGDAAGMQREIAWAAGKPEEAYVLFLAAQAEYSLGRTQRARETVRRAASLAESESLKEAAANPTSALEGEFLLILWPKARLFNIGFLKGQNSDE
jgi:hypothetical protein